MPAHRTLCTWTQARWPAGVEPKMRMTGTASTVVPSSEEKQ